MSQQSRPMLLPWFLLPPCPRRARTPSPLWRRASPPPRYPSSASATSPPRLRQDPSHHRSRKGAYAARLPVDFFPAVTPKRARFLPAFARRHRQRIRRRTLLIARETGLPVYVARQRFDAGQLAEGRSARKLQREQAAGPYSRRRLPAPPASTATPTFFSSTGAAGLIASSRPEIFANRSRPSTVLPLSPSLRRSPARVRPKGLGWTGPIWRLRRTMDNSPNRRPNRRLLRHCPPRQFSMASKPRGLHLAACTAFPTTIAIRPATLPTLLPAPEPLAQTALLTRRRTSRLGVIPAISPSRPPALHRDRPPRRSPERPPRLVAPLPRLAPVEKIRVCTRSPTSACWWSVSRAMGDILHALPAVTALRQAIQLDH